MDGVVWIFQFLFQKQELEALLVSVQCNVCQNNLVGLLNLAEHIWVFWHYHLSS